MSQIRTLPAKRMIAALVISGVVAFAVEKWALPEAVNGLTTNVILLVTTIVFLLQWREAFETRGLLLEEKRERDRPRLAFQLVPDMRAGQTHFAVINQGAWNVEARVRLELHWTEEGAHVQCSGGGLHGGEDSWIVHYGQEKSGHFTLMQLAQNPRGADPGRIVAYLTGRRRSDLSLFVSIEARNLEGGGEEWVTMPEYRWILRPDTKTWVADHEFRRSSGPVDDPTDGVLTVDPSP